MYLNYFESDQFYLVARVLSIYLRNCVKSVCFLYKSNFSALKYSIWDKKKIKLRVKTSQPTSPLWLKAYLWAWSAVRCTNTNTHTHKKFTTSSKIRIQELSHELMKCINDDTKQQK